MWILFLAQGHSLCFFTFTTGKVWFIIMLYDISYNIIIFSVKEGVFAMAYSVGPMTEAMYYVLLALMRPNHGYQLMQAISEVSNGRVNMGPGTLYGVLTRMQKNGLISLAEDDGRRKTYQITLEGEHALRVEYERLKALIVDSAILEEG
jgi:DNA-binding PadR family transcriptional regulator